MKTAAQLKKAPTWEAFCKLTKRDPKLLPDVSSWDKITGNKIKGQSLIAEHKIEVMLDWANEDADLSYGNPDTRKYYPWLLWENNKKKPSLSAFRLRDAIYVFGNTGAILGARLPAASPEIVEWICTKHIDLVNIANKRK